ncbi:MAG TPA: hypothetical protein VMG41_02905 [Gemmatimonadales bacterium]|nr:hypothetical protein [Gemmatimonadales bacterium]
MPPDPPSHPAGAVVVLTHGQPVVVTEALDSLLAAARAYGAEVLLLATPDAGGSPATDASPRRVALESGTSEAEARARALAETGADVIEFIDLDRAAQVRWDDVMPLRLGLVRLTAAPMTDLRAALERLGVPQPAGLPGRRG